MAKIPAAPETASVPASLAGALEAEALLAEELPAWVPEAAVWVPEAPVPVAVAALEVPVPVAVAAAVVPVAASVAVAPFAPEEKKYFLMQSCWQAAYFSVAALEPSPWSHFAAHAVVALTMDASGLGLPMQFDWQLTSPAEQD